MKKIDGLIREFDLTQCEDVLLPADRHKLQEAFLTGISAGVSLIMQAYKESVDPVIGLDAEKLAPKFEDLIRQLEEQTKRLRPPC